MPDATDGTGEGGTLTQAQVDELVKERLAEAKAGQDEAFQNLWKEAKKAKERAKAFGDLDPEDVRDKLAKLTELEQKGRAEKVGMTDDQLRKLRDDIRADLEKEYHPFKTKSEELGEQVRTLQLDNVVKKLMAEHGVRGERVDALFRLTASEFDLTEDGKPMLRAHPGREVEKYVSDELSKQYPEFFLGTQSSGGGASKSVGGAGGHVRAIPKGDNASFLANTERIAKGEVRVTE